MTFDLVALAFGAVFVLIGLSAVTLRKPASARLQARAVRNDARPRFSPRFVAFIGLFAAALGSTLVIVAVAHL